jgi:hypothetical protein
VCTCALVRLFAAEAYNGDTSKPTFKNLVSQVFSCRRLATAGNESLGRWGLPPPHLSPRCSACLTDGSLPRATKCLPSCARSRELLRLFAAEVYIDRRLSHPSGFYVLGGGCCPHSPAFRYARLVLQAFSYRGPRGAWQVVAGALITPLSAALGLSCRRLATAGSKSFGRWGLPPLQPRFPRRSACLEGGLLPRATKRLPTCAHLRTRKVIRFRCLQRPNVCYTHRRRSAGVLFYRSRGGGPPDILSAALVFTCSELAATGNECNNTRPSQISRIGARM